MRFTIWLGLLIGFLAGGMIGLIFGIVLADDHWKTKVCPYCEHDCYKADEFIPECCNSCKWYHPRLKICSKVEGREKTLNIYKDKCEDYLNK